MLKKCMLETGTPINCAALVYNKIKDKASVFIDVKSGHSRLHYCYVYPS